MRFFIFEGVSMTVIFGMTAIELGCSLCKISEFGGLNVNHKIQPFWIR